MAGKGQDQIRLPAPIQRSGLSVESALQQRRSIREYSGESVTLAAVSQLLWAAQGISDPSGKRTAPSAGALYPLEVYLIAGNVSGLAKGTYKYDPSRHALARLSDEDTRAALRSAALGQAAVEEGAAVIVLAAVYSRTTRKYGERGRRYVDMEAGHAAQNIYLESTFLNLGTVLIGAFGDAEVRGVLRMPANESPLGIMPVGNLRQGS